MVVRVCLKLAGSWPCPLHGYRPQEFHDEFLVWVELAFECAGSSLSFLGCWGGKEKEIVLVSGVGVNFGSFSVDRSSWIVVGVEILGSSLWVHR